MSRLQKKCFFASGAAHLLLFCILLTGPAFLSSNNKPAENLPLLRMIPAKLIDEATYGGGAPAATIPPASQPAEPPPQPDIPKPTAVQSPPRNPEPRRVLPEPARKPPLETIEKPIEPPPKVKPTPRAKNPADLPESEPPLQKKIAKEKHEVVPDLKPAERGPRENSPRKSKANEAARTREQARAADEARKSGIASSLKSLQESLSSSTTIEPVGTGGEAYANYAQAIKTTYTEAWITPEDVNDESATVQVTVTIARDGRVLSSSILKRSGIPELDRSVQNVSDRVKKLPPFPEGARDLQRTFKLNFNLKSKRILG